MPILKIFSIKILNYTDKHILLMTNYDEKKIVHSFDV